MYSVLQVASVSLSSLGRCGEFNTYSQYPDMNSDVWTSIKVGLVICIDVEPPMKLGLLFPDKYVVSFM